MKYILLYFVLSFFNTIKINAQDSFFINFDGYYIHNVQDNNKIEQNAILHFDIEPSLNEYQVFYINIIDSVIDNNGKVYDNVKYYPKGFVSDRSDFQITIKDLFINAKSVDIKGWMSIFDLRSDTKNYHFHIDSVKNKLSVIQIENEVIDFSILDLGLIQNNRKNDLIAFKKDLQFLLDVGFIKHVDEEEFDLFIKEVENLVENNDDYLIVLMNVNSIPLVSFQVLDKEGNNMVRNLLPTNGYLSNKGIIMKKIDLYSNSDLANNIQLSFFDNKYKSFRIKMNEILLDDKNKDIVYPLIFNDN